MHAAMAVPGSASTILTHLFGRGLADERYVVERYKAMADGDIRRWPGDEIPAKGRRKPMGPPVRHRVIAFGQHHRAGRLDSPARDRKVGDRTPYRFRQKPPVMDLDFGQRGERFEIDLLARGRT